MKVTVAYRVDIEDVPHEVHRLLEGVDSGLTACAVVSSAIQQYEGVSDILISDIASLQERVESILATLEDAKGIAKGYLSTISNPSIVDLESKDDNVD